MTKTITYCDICNKEIDRKDFQIYESDTDEEKLLKARAKRTVINTQIDIPGGSRQIDMCFACTVSFLDWLDVFRHQSDEEGI